MYYTADGTEITKQEIGQAVAEDRAVLRWCHGNWCNLASLVIFKDAEDAEVEAGRDTRGECFSMADEVWSELATYPRALRAAAGLLKVS